MTTNDFPQLRYFKIQPEWDGKVPDYSSSWKGYARKPKNRDIVVSPRAMVEVTIVQFSIYLREHCTIANRTPRGMDTPVVVEYESLRHWRRTSHS